MLPAELLRKIRRIQIRTSHLVSEALGGQYRSAFAGRGMEFEEVRPYVIGDEVRTIDWNVSARTGDPHVKVFREERELTVILLVDLSGSLTFGSKPTLKRELAAEFAATIAFSAIRNNDRVGLMGFSDRLEIMVPARKGSRHVLRIVRELLADRPAHRATNLAAALDELNRTVRRKSVVFVVSDFLDANWETAFRVARRKHDIIPVVVSDSLEQKLPAVGMVLLQDAETGDSIIVDSSSRRVRHRFQEAAEARTSARLATFRRMRADPIEIRTGESFTETLTQYFRRREARRSR